MLNRAAVWTTRALVQGPSGPAMGTASRALTAAEGCNAHWFRGLLAHAVGDEDARDRAWVEAMRGQPNSADAWFWLATIRREEDPQTAIEFYRRGLALRPTDGQGWLGLGVLLASRDPHAAMAAYLQSCHNGDPGYNGC